MTSNTGLLCLVTLIGLGLRVGLLLRQPATFETLPDQREYAEAGRSIREGRGLGFYDPRFGQTVYAYRLPGYPGLVAVLGVQGVRWFQFGVDLSTALAAYGIGVAVTGRATVGRLSAAVVACDPFLAYFSSLILTETVFTAVATWTVCAIVRRRWWTAIALMVAGVYLRPTMGILAPLMAMAANYGTRRPYRWTPVVGRAIAVVVILLVSLIPWAGRNRVLLGHWLWGTTNDGITLYDGFHPGADGSSDQRFLTDFPDVRTMNEYDRSRFFSGRAMHWIKDHPGEVIVLTFRKLGRGWSPIPLSDSFGRPAYRLVGGTFSVGLFVFALFGLFGSSIDRPGKFLLTSVIVGVSVSQMMSVGSIRYRMPAEPVLAVLAAAGIYSFGPRKSVVSGP